MRTAAKPIAEKPRKIGFEAPETLHGAIKSIVGWAEMNNLRPLGKPFSERELLQGLIAGLWEQGPDKWESTIRSNSVSIAKVISSPKKSMASKN